MTLRAVTTCRVFDVQRFSVHDGPGIRTTVFLEGCGLRCAWCHNPEAFRNGKAAELTPGEILDEVLQDREFYEVSGGGLTVSGGEPLLHPGPVVELLDLARKSGLHTCVQTAGAVPRANVAAVLGRVDLFQFDLKHMDSARHLELTGSGTERIHENAAFLLEQWANVQFRMPLVPGVNDGPAHLAQVAAFLQQHGVKLLHLVPYHRLYLDKSQALGLTPRAPAFEPPSIPALERVSAELSRHGIVTEIDG